MGANAVVGLVLIVAGLADCAIALTFVAPRIRDTRQREMISMAFVSGGALMVLLGVAIWAGVFGFHGDAGAP